MVFWQWEVAEVVLEVFYKLLSDYEPQLEDFVDQYVDLQGRLFADLFLPIFGLLLGKKANKISWSFFSWSVGDC